MSAPALSVVVVGFEMQREIERTVRSLAPQNQVGIEADEYEVIVVDNGSSPALDQTRCEQFGTPLRWLRIDQPHPSPAAAANLGIENSRAPLVGVVLDGARLASPGLLHHARLAARLHPRAVVASLSFHLGPGYQFETIKQGYDQAEEDRLLASIDWPQDGYRLFEISVLAASSRHGWFQAPAESNGLFMGSELWDELGGFDELFTSPGGGLVNLDLFDRACRLPGSQLVMLLGEGTFHQLHGGVTTSASSNQWEAFNAEFRRLRGRGSGFPEVRPISFGSPGASATRAIQDPR